MSPDIHVHEDNETHFVVSHGDSPRFVVAKAGIDEPTLAKLRAHHAVQAFADGGTVRPHPRAPLAAAQNPDVDPLQDISAAAAGIVPPDPGPQPYLTLTQRAWGNQLPTASALALRQQNEMADAGTAQPVAPPPLLAAPPSDEPPQAAPPTSTGEDFDTSIPVSEPTPGAVEASIAAGAKGVPPSADTTPMAGLEDEAVAAGKAKRDALQQQAQVVADKAKDDLQSANSNVQALQARIQKTQADFDDNQKFVDAAIQGVASGQVEPQRYFANQTTGQRVLGAIALALGGLGAGNGQGNAVVKMSNEAIGRDVEAQKSNLDNKRSLVSLYMQRGHSIDEAARLSTAMLQDVAAAKHVASAAKFAGPEAAAAAALGQSETRVQTNQQRVAIRDANLKSQSEQMKIAMEAMQLRMQTLQRPLLWAAEQGAVLPNEAAALLDHERRVSVPGGVTLANTKESRTEIEKLRQAHANAKAAADRVEKLAEQSGYGGTVSQEGELALVALKDSLQTMSGYSGAPRGPQEEHMERAFTNPTAFYKSKEGVQAQMKLYRDIIDRHLASAHEHRLVGGARAAAGYQPTGI